MTLRPTCSLEEISLEEILEDFKRFALAYRASQEAWVYEPGDISEEERRLTDHLLDNIVPITRTLTYFKLIHCQPREVVFSYPQKGVFGRRLLDVIFLHNLPPDDPMIFSTLTHETVHIFGGALEEAAATLLGWEVDARMALAGHKCHRISLYRCLRDMDFHVSYLKAKSVDQVDGWIDSISEFYGDRITREIIDENIERFEKGEKENMFGRKLSDYSVLPYLSIKGAMKRGDTYVVEEYEVFNEIEKAKIEMPALIQIWNE